MLVRQVSAHTCSCGDFQHYPYLNFSIGSALPMCDYVHGLWAKIMENMEEHGTATSFDLYAVSEIMNRPVIPCSST